MHSFYEEKSTKENAEIIEANQKINESKVIEKENGENYLKNSINSSVSTIGTIGTKNNNININTNLASISCPNCNWDIYYYKKNY